MPKPSVVLVSPALVAVLRVAPCVLDRGMFLYPLSCSGSAAHQGRHRSGHSSPWSLWPSPALLTFVLSWLAEHVAAGQLVYFVSACLFF